MVASKKMVWTSLLMKFKTEYEYGQEYAFEYDMSMNMKRTGAVSEETRLQGDTNALAIEDKAAKKNADKHSTYQACPTGRS